MRFLNIVATPHPSGNRIDLRWVHPNPTQFPGVRVVRREGTLSAFTYPDVTTTGGCRRGHQPDFAWSKPGCGTVRAEATP